MDKTYDQTKVEEKWYRFWEESGFFKPEIHPNGKSYTIILPPPNASGKMHTGNVLMIAIEDLLIRWRRMKGDAALWIPGTDHAGTETQITFERELKKEGKSRFDYSRKDFYQAIWDFVQQNKHSIESQIRQMGASIDWDRYNFTLDPQVIKTVHQTFKKMVSDDLVYRGDYIVNYCPKCGTTYSDVELKHEEKKDSLNYIKYKFVDKDGFISVATVRPETIWADTHLAVNPKDKKRSILIGKKVLNPLNQTEMEIIGDDFVDQKFGTGIVKLTPAVDKNDYEASLRHPAIPIIQVLDLNGKLVGFYQGLSVVDARKKSMEDLAAKNLVEKIDANYNHTVALCKAGHQIEPMVLPNWFIKTDAPNKSLKKPALQAVKDKKVRIFPKWREITYIRWMEEMRDWPISRQNVWGIRIPVWYKIGENDLNIWVIFRDKTGNIQQGNIQRFISDKVANLEEIKTGLQRVITLSTQAKHKSGGSTDYVISNDDPTIPGDKNKQYIPETDTFDTWFSSGQWPLVTLGYPDSPDFKKFYPTDILETGWEIIRLWVSRMIMFGIYLTNEPPFKDVYLHGIVKALDGRKMSKSLGNVINPEEYIAEYGVDALRMGLISGTANGKDFNFPKDRVISYKHFSNKIWNMARFILMIIDESKIEILDQLPKDTLPSEDQEIRKGLNKLIKQVDTYLEKYRFADAGEEIYQFMWHEIADKYIESVKNREDKQIALSNLVFVFRTSLELLHPFMPFITEELWQKLPHEGKSIMITEWPKA